MSRIKLAATLDRVRARLTSLNVSRDIVAASAVQAHMWPGALPAIPGFDCAAASLAARGVGGAFYDCFPIADSRWGLLLGDASGKGGAAGLVSSAEQARVNTAARLARLDPEELMAAVDRDIYGSTDGARYATARLSATSALLTAQSGAHAVRIAVYHTRAGGAGRARSKSRAVRLGPTWIHAALRIVRDAVTSERRALRLQLARETQHAVFVRAGSALELLRAAAPPLLAQFARSAVCMFSRNAHPLDG